MRYNITHLDRDIENGTHYYEEVEGTPIKGTVFAYRKASKSDKFYILDHLPSGFRPDSCFLTVKGCRLWAKAAMEQWLRVMESSPGPVPEALVQYQPYAAGPKPIDFATWRSGKS